MAGMVSKIIEFSGPAELTEAWGQLADSFLVGYAGGSRIKQLNQLNILVFGEVAECASRADALFRSGHDLEGRDAVQAYVRSLQRFISLSGPGDAYSDLRKVITLAWQLSGFAHAA